MPEIVLVYHDRKEADDRASKWLRERGWRTRALCPADGDALPMLDGDVAAAIFYAGRPDVRDIEKWPFLADELRWIEAALAREVPLLGFCLGAQLMAHVLGEAVGPHPEGKVEYGYYPLNVAPAGRALFGQGLTVLQSHWHGWFTTPPGAERLAGTEAFPEQAFRFGTSAYAFQFHPEATLTSLERWIGRRGERNYMPNAFPPERQIEDHARFDDTLGQWLDRFMQEWSASIAPARAAAE
ncbi:MAG: glutamine amidotransferase [Parvibaculaceae bacterium]